MIRTLEILGALILLALIWICIAEVFPPPDIFRDEQLMDDEEWKVTYGRGFGEDEGQEDGIGLTPVCGCKDGVSPALEDCPAAIRARDAKDRSKE